MSMICKGALLYNKWCLLWHHRINISRFQTFITRKCEVQITKHWNIPLFTSYVIDFQNKKISLISTWNKVNIKYFWSLLLCFAERGRGVGCRLGLELGENDQATHGKGYLTNMFTPALTKCMYLMTAVLSYRQGHHLYLICSSQL